MTKTNALSMSALALLLFVVQISAATLDGMQIRSTTSGKGPKTIILVHGWTCDETTWQSQVSALTGDYRVITLDLPGHGRSGSPGNGKLSMDLFARAIEAVRIEARADRVALAGHSMGTPVIIQYARLFPAHAAALVFVDGPFAPMLAGGMPSPAGFAGPDGRKAREGMIRSMFSAATTPDMQKHILSMMLRAPESTAVGAMEAMRDPAIWKDDVMTQPVLGLYADRPWPMESDMKKRFPNSEMHRIPGTGHFLMLEKAEEFNRLLQSFLDRQKF